MRIIPVMDIMDGNVVHAVGGRRENYKSLQSVLANTPNPLEVALAFESLGLKELYIADLDAICSKGQNSNAVERIASRTKLELMVDAGFRRADDVKEHVEMGVDKIVFATETLESFNDVRMAIAKFNLSVVVSIDVNIDRVIAASREMQLPLGELARKFEDVGASEILVLNLDRVGTSHGINFKTLREVMRHTSLPVITGGGAGGIEDVHRLSEEGLSGVLIATAFHNGAIKNSDIGVYLNPSCGKTRF